MAHLTPRPSPRQRAEHTTLTVSPDPAVLDERVDYFGNPVAYLLAWGRDYADVSPLQGVILGGGRHAVTVSVDVTPVV